MFVDTLTRRVPVGYEYFKFKAKDSAAPKWTEGKRTLHRETVIRLAIQRLSPSFQPESMDQILRRSGLRPQLGVTATALRENDTGYARNVLIWAIKDSKRPN